MRNLRYDLGAVEREYVREDTVEESPTEDVKPIIPLEGGFDDSASEDESSVQSPRHAPVVSAPPVSADVGGFDDSASEEEVSQSPVVSTALAGSRATLPIAQASHIEEGGFDDSASEEEEQKPSVPQAGEEGGFDDSESETEAAMPLPASSTTAARAVTDVPMDVDVVETTKEGAANREEGGFDDSSDEEVETAPRPAPRPSSSKPTTQPAGKSTAPQQRQQPARQSGSAPSSKTSASTSARTSSTSRKRKHIIESESESESPDAQPAQRRKKDTKSADAPKKPAARTRKRSSTKISGTDDTSIERSGTEGVIVESAASGD